MPEIGTAQTLFRQHAHDFTNKLLINHRLTETLRDGIPQCTPHRRERAASNVIQLSARDVQVISRQSSGTLANSQLVLMHGPASTWTSSAVAAGQHRRHQADRGRPRAGLGHLGRERHHRRRQPSSPSRRGTPSDDGEHGAAAGSRDAWSTVGQDPGTMFGPPTFLGERNLLTYGGNVRRNIFDITSAPTAPDRLELGAMQAVDLSGLTAFPPCCHPACRRRWPGGAAAARRDDPATVSPRPFPLVVGAVASDVPIGAAHRPHRRVADRLRSELTWADAPSAPARARSGPRRRDPSCTLPPSVGSRPRAAELVAAAPEATGTNGHAGRFTSAPRPTPTGIATPPSSVDPNPEETGSRACPRTALYGFNTGCQCWPRALPGSRVRRTVTSSTKV